MVYCTTDHVTLSGLHMDKAAALVRRARMSGGGANQAERPPITGH